MIYIIGHCYPNTDIDSVFSSILFSNFVNKYYKMSAKPFCGTNNKYIKTILKKLNVEYPKKYTQKTVNKEDLFIFVDHNDPKQSSNYLGFNNKVLGIVDHHKDTNKVKALKFKIIKKYGAVATIIYNMYKKHNIKITKKLAHLFLYAIIADTKDLKLDTTTTYDKKAVEELYSIYKLRSRKTVFNDLYGNLDSFIKKPINRLLKDGLKNFEIKNKKIYISDININNKFNRFKDLKKHLPLDKYDLCVVMFKNLQEGTTKIMYFGELSKYFKNKTYNSLKSRKGFVYPKIRKRILGDL